TRMANTPLGRAYREGSHGWSGPEGVAMGVMSAVDTFNPFAAIRDDFTAFGGAMTNGTGDVYGASRHFMRGVLGVAALAEGATTRVGGGARTPGRPRADFSGETNGRLHSRAFEGTEWAHTGIPSFD